MKKVLIIIFSILIFLGVIFGITDYNRIKSGEKPIFMIRITDGSKTIHEYIGLFYRMQREVGVSYKEELYQDNKVKFGLWFYIKDIDIPKPVISYSKKIETDESNICDKEELYYTGDGYNIYTYCIKSIILDDGKEKLELKDIIKDNNNIIDGIINELIPKDTLKDGGTTIYKDSMTKNFTNNGLTVIKCNTLSGNRDIYIGPDSMEFEEHFCKNNIKYYTKTYTVLNVESGAEENSYYFTLKLFQGEVDTVFIKNMNDKVLANKTYEFKFKKNSNNVIEDNIKSVFENSDIISIKETSKEGFEQIQDNVN